MEPSRGSTNRSARHAPLTTAAARAAQSRIHNEDHVRELIETERQRNQRLQATPDVHQTPSHQGSGPPPNPFRLHRARVNPGRLSMPFDGSDGSDSEPDLSHLGMVRGGRNADLQGRHANASAYAEDVLSQDEEEGQGSSVMGRESGEEVPGLADPATLGLKEISNLGKFTLSSHKQGAGVEELRNDDTSLYWQSDGPQPHRLTVYFVKRVGIREIRFFVDYTEDESYTPTKIVFKSGTSENNLIEFASMNLNMPEGWQQVPIAGAGGGADGNTLVSYVLQMQILENHQNGKDTHLRGIKIYAFDADVMVQESAGAERGRSEDVVDASAVGLERRARDDRSRLDQISHMIASKRLRSGDGGSPLPDFIRDDEIR